MTSPAPDQIAVCPACGALVGDTDTHDRWHDTDSSVDAATFLAAIDPATLEQAALNDPRLPDMGSDNGLTRMMLTILQEWSRGV